MIQDESPTPERGQGGDGSHLGSDVADERARVREVPLPGGRENVVNISDVSDTTAQQDLSDGWLEPEHLASLVDRAPAGMVVVDEGGTVRYANETALSLLGHQSLLGEQFGFPLTKRRTSLIELRDADGRLRETEMQVTRVRTDGRLTWLVTLHDVTHRSDDARKLLDAVQQRDDVVALASHELRNPLAAMTAATEALARQWEQMPPIRRLSLLRRILEQTWRMDDTITRVLDATGLDAGMFQAEPSTSTVIDVILDGAPHLRDLIGDLDVRVPENVTAEVSPSHLWTIISNLLVNAAKFAGGLVTVTARTKGEECVLTVSDEGPGIPEDQREAVFDRYVRLPRDTDLDGLGLGLWIVRGVAEVYGGSVHVEEGRASGRGAGDVEPPACGTRVVVRLPASASSPPSLRSVHA